MSNKTSDEKVANIEDDVKLVKRYLENSAYKESDSDFFKNGGWEMVDLEIPKAIEHLLQDYTRQKQINEEHQKINGELREKVKELEEQVEYDKTHIYTPMTIQLNFIPKQKIKDKIEEIEKEENLYAKTNIIRVLQELLQEDK